MSRWSQRPRFWSASRIGSPSGPMRAFRREAWISISATRPCTSGSDRRQPGKDAAEPQRFLAKLRPDQVVAGGRRIALVEDQVEDVEHRRQPLGAVRAARHLERHAGLRQRALGAHDALRDGRLGDEEGAGDLLGGQAAEQPQRQRDARLGRKHRMAGGEDRGSADRRRCRRRERPRCRARPCSCSISIS